MISGQKDINNELFEMAFFPSKSEPFSPLPGKKYQGRNQLQNSAFKKHSFPFLSPYNLISTVRQAPKLGMKNKFYMSKNIIAAFYSFHFQSASCVWTYSSEKNFLKLTIYMKRGTMLCNAPIYCPRATLNLSIQRSGGLACKKP